MASVFKIQTKSPVLDISFIAFFIAINCCMRKNLLTVSFIGNTSTNKEVGLL
jgi:hypothetical protein